MRCPKCNHEQEPAGTECVKCGIIFEKYNKIQHNSIKQQSRVEEKSLQPSERPGGSIGRILFSSPSQINPFFFAGRAFIFLVILVWGVKLMSASIESNYAGRSFMHLINLPFHEAGHIIFRPFGAFITSLGGSLGQLLMPLICLCVLLFQTRDPFGASVSLWWFGENFIDLAPYINDARSLSLPLLGGNVGRSSPYGFHDWEYILTESGLLQYDHFIAGLSFCMGVVLLGVSFCWGGYLLFRQYKNLMIL